MDTCRELLSEPAIRDLATELENVVEQLETHWRNHRSIERRAAQKLRDIRAFAEKAFALSD